MKKLLTLALLLFSFSIFSQEKIPLIDYDEIAKEASKHSESNDYNSVLDVLDKINKNDSTYSSILVSKSYYLLNAEKYQEAINVTNEGLALDDLNDKASFYINKGLSYIYLEKYEDALNNYNEGIESYPNNNILWHNKGVTLEKLKRIKEATNAYKQSIRLNPIYAKSHLQLGNICYRQKLISQALMCYNVYLLLTFDEEGAFETLKSLNNIVAQKNENEANPDLEISNDDETFEDIDLILDNKISLNKKYKTGNKIEIPLTRQNHALLNQLKDHEGNGGFWDKKYVPLFNWINENNLFNSFVYTLSYPIQNEKYIKVIKQNEKEITTFIDLFYDKWSSISKTNTVLFNGKKQDVVYHYYNGYTQAIGKMNNDVSIGKWKFYNSKGQLSSEGEYNDAGESQGQWTWYHKNGTIRETAIYKNDMLNGENIRYHENGKLYTKATLKNDELDGEYRVYNDKGALTQKKYFINGKLDGLYKSFFNVGEELLEFHIPYKEDAVESAVTEYYANGKIYSKSPYENGKRHGIQKKYFINGNPSYEINYQNGELSGDYKSYYINGNINETGQSLENFYNGAWKSYYSNGTLKIDYTYNKGYLDGLYKYYDTDGKIYYEYLYRKGEVIEYKYYNKKGEILSQGRKKGGEFKFVGHHPNGNISSKGLYDIKGGKEGFWEFFSSNGVLTSKGNHTEDKVIGEYINYYNSGKIKSKSNYKNDSLHGYYTDYYKNGQLKQQGWYKDNLLHGEWHTYYTNGTLEIVNFFHKDKLHGIQKYYATNGKLDYTYNYKYGELLSEVYFNHSGDTIDKINYKPKANNFLITRYHTNKTVASKTEFVNGLKHGKYISYNFYGNIKTEGQYNNGNLNGKWTWYYDNGKIESTREYLDGNLNGEGKDYFEDGTLSRTLNYEYGNLAGTWVSYHKNGNKYRTTEYVNNKMHGKRIFYDHSEKLQLIRFYNHGTIIGYSYLDKQSKELPMIPIINETAKITSYFDNGKVARELEYKNGDLVNTYNQYYYSGQLENKMSFVDDEYDGTDIEYYENGNIKKERNYKIGVLQGASKEYYENGNVKKEETFLNDLKTGETNYYNETGKLTKKEYYFNGKIYKFETY